MFRKLVSNLSFSPALITEIGFYARRLRNEEVTRRTTVLFVVLALIMQSLAIFSPPESANASSEQDIIRGGVSSLDDLLVRFDHNEADIKDIYSAIGVTRSELAAARPGKINSSNDNIYILTRYGQLADAEHEVSVSYPRSSGGVGTRYFSPLKQISKQNVSFEGWVGKSANIGWFAVIKSNGSLVTQGLPSAINPTSASSETVTKMVGAVNLTQGSVDASSIEANPLDKLAYKLIVTNPSSSSSVTASFSIRLSDVLDYSNLIDAGGADFDTNTNTLTWPIVQLKPGELQERTFAVQLFNELPLTPTGHSNPASYDCILSASFGNNVQSPVSCPAIKGAENLIQQLPPTSITTNLIFAAALLITTAYFYARTRQMKKELRIIRHDLNAGII